MNKSDSLAICSELHFLGWFSRIKFDISIDFRRRIMMVCGIRAGKMTLVTFSFCLGIFFPMSRHWCPCKKGYKKAQIDHENVRFSCCFYLQKIFRKFIFFVCVCRLWNGWSCLCFVVFCLKKMRKSASGNFFFRKNDVSWFSEMIRPWHNLQHWGTWLILFFFCILILPSYLPFILPRYLST